MVLFTAMVVNIINLSMNYSGFAGLTFYVGTYTNSKGDGIYICSMDPDSGAIHLESIKKGIINPSFLAIDHKNLFLFSVNEISDVKGLGGGFVSAFRINEKKYTLEFINKKPSGGSAPCHLIIDNKDRFVLVSNYTSGNIAVLPVSENGRLGPPVEIMQHEGSGINPKRQRVPHPHSTILDASGNYAFVPDLGIDKVMIYKFNSRSGKLSPHDRPFIKVVPGAGPRHIVFHPDSIKAYLINELNSTLTVFDFNAKTGDLNETQTISTLPTDFSGENACADLHIGYSGQYVYASNRGHDSIVVFAADKSNGELSVIQHQHTLGKTPRSFAIDPIGRFLLVANQNSDTIVVFAIDPLSGKLFNAGYELKIPTPVCLKFKLQNTDY